MKKTNPIQQLQLITESKNFVAERRCKNLLQWERKLKAKEKNNFAYT